ncbi:TPA: hypothetical protein ACN73J_005328 [Klebsiella pneumoniae]|uniref:Uncharacterized protein n=1 Tax=Enterobacter chengduensis TaxID=2494701 RepID=A0AAW3HLB5_9ENTR|nr:MULTISPECIES: hypothetical protein [Enterobacteriaceae]KDF49640.1 hypothetical protein AE07_01025 [Enterobacter cloacae BWH 43]KJX38589.1 hypothetical protein SG71_02225 [Enterobacter chengduensis]MBW5750196.1 hypothetical protein [Klebsiella pneumoniae]MCU3851557.1 hypothetical protein [Enterobacter roggenkampii]GKP83436.1 hypothetical protein NUKP48_39170 [Klebsiella quasipneumoniae]
MKNVNELSKDELLNAIVAQAKEYATVDFDQLEKDGIIKQVRGGYLVVKHSKLPDAARKLMKSLKSTKDGVQMIISKPPKSFLDLGK